MVRTPEAQVSAHELREYLSAYVAKWWLPEHWAFVETLPKTSVGKFDKRALRRLHAEGRLNVESL